MTINLDTLRKTAEAPGVTPGPWEVWKNVHCDPVVVPAGKPWAGITDPKMPFEKIAGLSTAPDDYGRANLEYIATFDPPTVLALLSRLGQAEQAVARVREALTEVQTRGEKIRAKGNNGSIYQQERAARGEGYLEATRLAFRALDGDGRG